MKKSIYIIICITLIMTIFVFDKTEASPTISYISSEGFYINGGTNYNLKKNDTLLVIRDTVVIATCVINNISKSSSACVIIEKSDEIIVGDKIVDIFKNELALTEVKEVIQKQTKRTSMRNKASVNHVSGYISSQHYIVADLSNSSLSSYQPSLRTKFKISNLFGQKLKFQIKHRSRYYKRSQKTYMPQNQSNWSHRIYEFAIYSTDNFQALQYSIGRQAIYQMRGVGFVDGVYVGNKINDKISVGTAVGFEPDYLNQKISFNRKKAGVFVSYAFKNSQTEKLMLSVALAGSYIHSDISREYLYLQTDYNSNKFTVNQSVEIDYYRTWRKEALDKRFSLTSYYGRVNYSMTSHYSFNLSFDTRERIRYHVDSYIADSLFDDSNNRGLKFGARLKPIDKLSISINTGLRFRAGSMVDNKFGSIAITALRFPQKRSSLTARLSYLETMFTTAYRPSLSYRFPVKKGMYMTVSGASYMYSSSIGRSSTSYLDANTYYTLSNNYYLSASMRQYLEKDLRSNQLFFEFGKHF